MSINENGRIVSKLGTEVWVENDWASDGFVLKQSRPKTGTVIEKADAGTLALDVLKMVGFNPIAVNMLEEFVKEERGQSMRVRRNKRALELWKDVGGSKRLEEGTPEWTLLMKLVEQEEKSA